MKITDVKVETIHIPMKKPFRIAFAVQDHSVNVLVKITTDEGLWGIGEAAPFEPVTGESTATVLEALKLFRTGLIGMDPLDIEGIHCMMDRLLSGNTSAKAAVDIALYDIKGKLMGQPLYKVLAGVLLLLFVGLRYKKTAGFSSGVVSLVTMMHDCLLSYGVLVLLGFRAGSAFVAAAATVCCCSLINSVILYDAIRENRRVMSVNATVAELLNQSVAQCAPKLLAFTILLALGAVCAGVVGMVLDVTVLDIAVPVLAGVLCAFYSATCLNGALWSLWQERQQGKAAAAKAAKAPKSKGKSKK